ncbi:discoidin domain-containing protein, partial [Dactylosporangium sp. NPDC005572]|uniref:galactose-binding domain-containing protein n=1 Tax=Dactylosporangium sp. NPDC005572 TaxID=3156889 RepID=UPI0033BB2AEE
YGRAYQIQTSPDNSTWTTVYSTTTGDGGVDDLNVTGTGRYVRVYGTQRGLTQYGYSLWELDIYGS